MALVVEDGTGLADANGFCEVAYAEAYATDRGITVEADPSQWASAIIEGGDYLANEARFCYRGRRSSSTQRLPYPRTGAIERGGLAIAEGTVPWRLQDANAALAVLRLVSGTALQEDLVNGGLLVQRKTIDVLTTTWFPPSAGQLLTALPGETVRVDVLGFLAPLLHLPGRQLASVTFEQSEMTDHTPFASGEFDA